MFFFLYNLSQTRIVILEQANKTQQNEIKENDEEKRKEKKRKNGQK